MTLTVMLKQPNRPTLRSFLDSTESRCYASDVQRGVLPLLRFGKREKITEKFRRAYAAFVGSYPGAAITVTFASFGCDGWGPFNMTVRVKLARNKMSRGYTLVWSDDPLLSRNPSEWNGIVGETRESLTWARDLLKCWSKRKAGLNAALNEHPNIRGTWSRSFVAGRSQLTCYFRVRGSSSCVLCAQAR
jgi:hypothetical protein